MISCFLLHAKQLYYITTVSGNGEYERLFTMIFTTHVSAHSSHHVAAIFKYKDSKTSNSSTEQGGTSLWNVVALSCYDDFPVDSSSIKLDTIITASDICTVCLG